MEKYKREMKLLFIIMYLGDGMILGAMNKTVKAIIKIINIL